jgi:phosphatidylserine/phosphatidylglycerophosphate/cardiolipin synthase-like enzyme
MQSSNTDTPRASSINLLTKSQYFQDLNERIAATKSGHIVISTMTFRPGLLEVRQLLHTLGQAAKRGIQVTLLVDAICYLVGEQRIPGPLFFGNRPLGQQHLLPHFETIHTLLEEFAAKGGTYTLLNRPTKRFSNVYAGRSHIKFAVINDQAYVGNCNLNSKDQLDIMVRWKHKKLANFFIKLTRDIIAAGGSVTKALSGKDTQFAIQKNATLLLDAGVPDQSLIMDAALHAINASKESIFVTTQFFVNKVIAEHLLRAERRGVQVTILYNNVKNHHLLEKIMVSSILLREKRRLPSSFFSKYPP